MQSSFLFSSLFQKEITTAWFIFFFLMKIHKDELYFFLHNRTNDRKIRNLIDAFCWKSLPVSSGIEKKFHDLLSPGSAY